jgi:LmbE family N-acetylglucosaminyl deacetylase
LYLEKIFLPMKIFARLILCCFLFSVGTGILHGQIMNQPPSSGIFENLKRLTRSGSVLYIAAHPDDENTRLLAWMAGEMKIEATYLSLTRGDGGQNLVGNEQGDLLGLIRTEELIAARNIDKANQVFTRAKDFGYSKTPEETFAIWNKDSVLSDVVFLIRLLRPSVIICRFPNNGDGGHGHHTASALLAEDAFDMAGDPNKFSWQLKYVEIWKPKRLLWNAFIRGKTTDLKGFYSLDVGSYNSLTGNSIGEISARSRSCHKSQGFGSTSIRGEQMEYFKHIKGDSAKTNDIFEGISFGGSKSGSNLKFYDAAEKVIASFNFKNPAASVPGLIKLKTDCKDITDPRERKKKESHIDACIRQCLGLYFEVVSDSKFSVPGKKITGKVNCIFRAGDQVVFHKLSWQGKDSVLNKKMEKNKNLTIPLNYILSESEPYSSPHWLLKKGSEGLFSGTAADEFYLPSKAGAPEFNFTFLISGNAFNFNLPLHYKWTDPVQGEKYCETMIVPPLAGGFLSRAQLLRPGVETEIKIYAEAFGSDFKGKISLFYPKGWDVSPSLYTIDSLEPGKRREFVFKVKPYAESGNQRIEVKYLEQGKSDWQHLNNVTRVSHEHIPEKVVVDKASLNLVIEKVEVKAKIIGYIPGAGDEIPAYLTQMGCKVELLDEQKLMLEDLGKFDAIVTGIRAFNTHEWLSAENEKLNAYVFNGGTLIIQYNTNSFFGSLSKAPGPYHYKISRDRVTDENAEVKILKPEHPLVSKPNKIIPADFLGWVQERGLYFASDFDPKFQAVFSMNDPGEKPLEGSLITAVYGKGHFVYTGLSFFRQLPAGVPGAYKLFANLISLGK